MKILERLRKKKRAQWIVYNPFDVQEFAECSKCGFEVVPDLTEFPENIYPAVCPKCKSRMKYSDT